MDGPLGVVQRVLRALNEHDLDAFLDCFHSDYRSEQPAHPKRGFGGREQVRKNWTAIFAGVPDFAAELVAATDDGDVAWTEWRWRGTHADGRPSDTAGVILFGIRDGRIASARLYMEPLEADGGGIDEAVQRMAGGPGTSAS